ncbi:MAG: NADH-quinone oxidoreductase subunit C [Candidatus Omnitrophica bacterium]|nr:NADH-quinone oxidoreductase subunit C [Candidatus Omnitrophota bacterium]MBU4589917.1 NADH-quinone oxidoreductase subunit C [Candidatus Omnitrophota bacterium]
MRREDIIENIKVRAGKDMLDLLDRSERRVYVTIKKEILPKIVRYLFNDAKARFAIASGVDTRKAIEILYHFSFDAIGLIVSLRVILEKSNLEIDSLTPVMKCAEWIEREIHEYLGVNFKGHPNLKHLLLRDDWPEGKYPLRRDQ